MPWKEALAMNVISITPRSIRAAPDPLALYLRPGRIDHREMLNLIAAGHAACFGAVFDPTLADRHAELREQVLVRRLDAILDPKTQPSATAGGYTEAIGKLPWGVGRPHIHSDFESVSGQRVVASLSDFAIEKGFTQLLAPTHLLRSADDTWLGIDSSNTHRLRARLDRTSGAKIPIIYSLAISY